MTKAMELKLKARLEKVIKFRMNPPQIKGCDNTYKIIKKFCFEKRLDVDYEINLLKERGGGCCDCEVLLNVDLGEV